MLSPSQKVEPAGEGGGAKVERRRRGERRRRAAAGRSASALALQLSTIVDHNGRTNQTAGASQKPWTASVDRLPAPRRVNPAALTRGSTHRGGAASQGPLGRVQAPQARLPAVALSVRSAAAPAG